MRLKHIETLVDTIDPYFLVKDLGLKIINHVSLAEIKKTDKRTLTSDEKLVLQEYAACINQENFDIVKLLGQSIRVLPYGFLNLTNLQNKYVNSHQQTFVAGSVIDLLSFYCNDDYDQAFDIFVKQYGDSLKDKSPYDIQYIEKITKPIFVTRRNITNFLVKKLFLNDNNSEGVKKCRNWAERYNVGDINGYGFYENSKNIYNMLMFFEHNALLDYSDEQNTTQTTSTLYSDFIKNHLFKESNEWVVIPYFVDFHRVGAIKFINPKDNTFYLLELVNSKFSFAGIYRLPWNIDFTNTKIRISENENISLQLGNFAKQTCNEEELLYLSINYNSSAPIVKSSLLTFNKPIVLHEEGNTNLSLERELYDAFTQHGSTVSSELYICLYKDFREDNSVYTFDAWIEREFKRIINTFCVNTSTGLCSYHPELSYFLNSCQFNNRKVKAKLMKWLLNQNYIELFNKLSELDEDYHEYRNLYIKPTNHGYVSKQKDDSKRENETLITNFSIKVDKNIIFPELDDILHKGRLIMGVNEEYPLIFYKNELNKGNPSSILEKIALRAFTKATFSTFDDEQKVMPIIFDPKLGNILMNIVQKEIHKASCVYGVMKPGWDYQNNIFNAVAWKVSGTKSTNKIQTIHTLNVPIKGQGGALTKDIQNCYVELGIDVVPFDRDLSFLNKNIKDIICSLLGNLYRSYLGYETKPVYILDSVYSRNLIKFIFSVFSQIKPLNIPGNGRILKNNGETLNAVLNKYPLYAKCLNIESEKTVMPCLKDYPIYLLIQDTNIIPENVFTCDNITYSQVTYKKIASFTLETLQRFFKWIFMVPTQEVVIPNNCETLIQLIEEGNNIFSYLWWDDIVEECEKDINPESALKGLLSCMTCSEIKQHINYYPEKECYVLKRLWLKEEPRKASVLLYKVLKQAGKAWKDEEDQTHYIYIDKEFFEECSKGVLSKNMKPIEIVNYFVSPELAITTTKYNTPKRSITKKELQKRLEAEMPGYTPDKFKKLII